MGSKGADRLRPVPGNLEHAATQVVDSAIEVHRALGPGFGERIYQSCLAQELRGRQVSIEQEVSVPVTYKGRTGHGYLRLDLLVEGGLVVELKSVDRVTRAHRKQVLSYLRLTGHRLGLLLNSDVALMRAGISRIIR